MKVLFKTMDELKETTSVVEASIEDGGSFIVNNFYCSVDMKRYLGKVVEVEKKGLTWILTKNASLTPWEFVPEMVKEEIVSEKHIYFGKSGKEYVFLEVQ